MFNLFSAGQRLLLSTKACFTNFFAQKQFKSHHMGCYMDRIFSKPDCKRVKMIHAIFKHVQYCQSDTDRKSTSRPDKLLRTVSIPYGRYLFVSALGGRLKRLHNQQDMPTVRTVRTIRTDREPIHEPSQIVRRTFAG